MSARYNVGDMVHRLDGSGKGVIVTIGGKPGEHQVYEVEYDEGGRGWWPEGALIPDPATKAPQAD